MFRYIAFSWDFRNPSQLAVTERFAARVREHLPDLRITMNNNGLMVFVAGVRPASSTVYRLAAGRGVVLGKLFKKSPSGCSVSDTDFLDESRATALVKGGPEHLVENYWGRYVAFFHDADSAITKVMRDPSGGLPCFATVHESITIFFSWMEDCFALNLRRYTINWHYVSLVACEYPIQSRETGLEGVFEVQLGECVEVQRGVTLRKALLWDPVRIAQNHNIDDFASATDQVRTTVQTCITAWASCYPSVALLLSGGLDSSIVLACLANMPSPPAIRCINYYDTTAAGDERPFARLAASRAGCSLTELAMDPAAVPAQAIMKFARFASPTPWAEAFYTRTKPADLASEWGASAIFDGNFGDSLFFYYSDPALRFADLLYYQGLRTPDLLRQAFATAARQRRSIWSVLGSGVRRGLLRPPCDPTAYFGKWRWFVTPESIAHARAGESFVAEYLASRPRLSPGKFEQILGLAFAPPFYGPISRANDAEPVPVLTSQLLRELLLRIPTYILTNAGQPRAVARNAFAAAVPPEILARSQKGIVSNYLARFLRQNATFVRDMLLDGLLIDKGILDGKRVEEFFSGRKYTNIRLASELVLYHFAIEAWAQSWSGATQQQAAA